MGNLTEIDRLIEEGLAHYGQGNLDAALQSWERALGIDPTNAQANSYVEYVRDNYELLTTEVGGEVDEKANPFGIHEDEPEYQIEILEGEELEPGDPHGDAVDQGWFIEDESGPRRGSRTRSADIPTVSIELEADEPPLPEPRIEIKPISFDDETREYPGGPPKQQPEPPPLQPPLRAVSELPMFTETPDPVTTEFQGGQGEFQPEGTPGFGHPSDYQTPPGGFQALTPGFDSVTDVRRRDTGFVQPAAPEPPPDNDVPLGPAGPRARRASSQIPPELKMTLRTPGDPLDIEIGPAGMEPTPERDPNAPYEEPTGEYKRNDPAALELINSLPSPTPVPPIGGKVSTRDMPSQTRQPAQPTGELAAAPGPGTRDFPQQKTDKLPPNAQFALQQPATRDLATGKLPNLGREMITAPTRDLGMRPPPPPPTEDEPTTLRKPRLDTSGTKSDVILPFDPIDARSAQILDDIDDGAPAREAKEDRTRRRISRLFERAIEWNKAGELDRAVAAIDLALSEDPNSALAQKLIHRNRDTMMTVFQSFLGDLQRQPMLARPLHELASAPISPRAAFLLSRVDGTLSLDEILDVSGMPRIEAYRYLCQLFLRGILR